jgi:hypothetical protein
LSTRYHITAGDEERTMSVTTLVPYEVPEEDRDLLNCGIVLTPEYLLNAGFTPCPQCGDLVPPHWNTLPYCTVRCHKKHTQVSFAEAVRESEKKPYLLHYVEVGHLALTLERLLREQGLNEVWVEVGPLGYKTTIAERSYVGASTIKAYRTGQYNSLIGELCLPVLDLLGRTTVVPVQSQHMRPRGVGDLEKNRPVQVRFASTSWSVRERHDWIWYAHGAGWTFPAIGEKVGISASRAQQVYQRMRREGRHKARRLLYPKLLDQVEDVMR